VTERVGSTRDHTRAHVVETAAGLLATGGREAVTTRAVAAAAGIQAPTIYRMFGDKNGLLDAVAEHGYRAYLEQKVTRPPAADPVDDLRTGWDLHVGFGLANPALYALMYGDPRPGTASAAAVRSLRMLRAHISRVAGTGRLRVGEEHAVNLIHAAACGTVFTLLALDEERRDPALSEHARAAVFAAIITDTPTVETPGPATAAVALRAVLGDVDALTAGERALLGEWLDRVASGARLR
jgi:AcrR family transcriptional regulator